MNPALATLTDLARQGDVTTDPSQLTRLAFDMRREVTAAWHSLSPAARCLFWQMSLCLDRQAALTRFVAPGCVVVTASGVQ